MKKILKKISFLLVLSIFSLQSFAQERLVSGEVLDANNSPLPGVAIQVGNSSVGTTTDFDGKFSLSVPDNDDTVLKFSFIGFVPQEIRIGSQSTFKVIMQEDAAALDEVVVVGYGTQQKANLTGAVGQVNAENIALRPSANISSALQGQLPGLNIQVNDGDPSATPDINIRGFNSINSGGPLVLVDGIEGNISRVNPQDIASVTVLKDAASAAIYGARGAYGVILITTKTGKAGDISVNYTNNFNWTTPTTRTDFIKDPYQLAVITTAAQSGYNGANFVGPMAGWDSDLDWETMRMVANGEIEPFHEVQPDGSTKFFHNFDWYNHIFKKWQASSMHNISISGGSEKLKGYLSGRLYDREQIQNIQDGEVKRYNLKSRLTFSPTEWLEIYNNTTFSHEKDKDFSGYRTGYGGTWSNLWRRNKWSFIPFEVDGIPLDIGRSGRGGYGDTGALAGGNNWRLFNTEEFRNTIGLKITPLKGLEVNFDYSNRIQQTARTIRLSEFDVLTGNKMIYETDGINRVSEYRWRDYYKVLNAYATYTFDIGGKVHNFKILGGYNQEDFDRDRLTAEGSDLLVRELHNISTATEMYNIDGSASAWAIQGYFGRFNYNFKEKYLLEINGRYDGSSRFPSESRWGFFPSVSVGWQIDRENFWNSFDGVFSGIKLRASYGELGDQNVGLNTFRRTMSVGQSDWLDSGTRLTYARAPNALPRIVSWETTGTLDLGVDLGFFKNKLNVNFDWYEKNVHDMYLPGQPLPAVFGRSEPRENYASLRNTGFELSLNYRNSFSVAGSPLALNLTASVSNFKGVITKYNNPEGLMSTYWEGQELGVIYGYHVDGQFQSDEEALAYQNSFDNPSKNLNSVYNWELNRVRNSEWKKLRAGDLKYIDTNGDGKIDNGKNTLDDHGDLRPIGNTMPKFPFGFNINANYRGFDLSIAGAGVGKQHWAPRGQLYWGTYGPPHASFLRKDMYDNAWSPENPSGTYPQIDRGFAAYGSNRSLWEINDHTLINIGYFRIKNLTLGYTLPNELTSKFKVRKLRIYFSGENIYTWRFGSLTKYIDPEQAGSGINFSNPGSVDERDRVMGYPMGKTYSVGINLTL